MKVEFRILLNSNGMHTCEYREPESTSYWSDVTDCDGDSWQYRALWMAKIACWLFYRRHKKMSNKLAGVVKEWTHEG